MDLDFRSDPRLLCEIVDAMDVGVFTVDVRGTLVAWNGGAERITGYTAAEVVGRSCRLFEGAHCKGFAALTELLAGSRGGTSGSCSQECRLVARDGREVRIHGHVRLLQNADGTTAGAVATFSDLTEFLKVNQRVTLLEEEARERDTLDRLGGSSLAMQEVTRRIRLAAHSDVTVFIGGESGTGKELAARAVHDLSPRRGGPFVAVHCAAIPEALLESELFGHARGAFTGATQDRAGLFREARGGTLFLDEIGELAAGTQVKLLRVLQEREVRGVGESRPERIDVRVITATNRDLRSEVAAGRMREDFYYRIHVFAITMPPLRERREDVPGLARRLAGELGRSYGRVVRSITRDALDFLMDHSWPGNVRELRNAIEHAMVSMRGDTIELMDLPLELRQARAVARSAGRSWSVEEEAERARIRGAMAASGGNRTRAAALLGTSRVTLWKKLKRLGLEHESG